MLYSWGGGINSTTFRNDSLIVKDGLWIPFASFHYAVIRDTFLYTASTGSYGLHCINIANPESIFVAWTNEYYFGFSGLEVVDSVVYSSSASTFYVSPPDDWHSRPHWYLLMADVSGDTSVVHTRVRYFDNEHHCSITSNENYLFYVYTEMSDFIAGEQDYTLGDSHLGIWDTDYSFTWADYDSEGVFGVDVLNDRILAVGFEHGFSILDYSDLDDIREVAYYRDTDSIFAFTHFALKENRMFAMAHPRAGICRMYMFELDERVISGIGEPAPQTALPAAFEISAWPNPFNSAVTISLDAPVGAHGRAPLQIEIFDLNGRRVAQLPDGGTVGAGFTPALNDVADNNERDGARPSPTTRVFTWTPAPSLPSGVYLVRARFDPRSLSGAEATNDGRGDLAPTGQTASTKLIVYLK